MLHILFIMFFLHILDDFVLQGKLGDFKQKLWWENHPQYCKKYKNDFWVALIIHSFSWTFMIMLPWLYMYKVGLSYVIVFAINMAIHAVTDHYKANKLAINLVQDQSIHAAQIIVTFLALIFLN